MNESQREDAGLSLLLEDYHQRASKRGAKIAPAASLPSPDPSAANGHNLHLLIEDYPARSAAWLARFERESVAGNGVAVIAGAPSEEAGPPLRLLVDDYAPAERFPVLRSRRRPPNGPDISDQPDAAKNIVSAPDGPEPQPVRAGIQTPIDLPAPELNSPAAAPPLDLLVDWEGDYSYSRQREGRAASIAVHALFFLFLVLQPRVAHNRLTQEDLSQRQTIKLTQPPPDVLAELTQKAPNKGKITNEFSALTEAPRPLLMAPTATAPAPSVKPPTPKIEPPEPKIEVEPPKPEPAPAPTEPEVAKEEPPAAPKPVPPQAQTTSKGEFQPGAQIARNLRPNELPAPRRPTKPDPKPKLEFEAPPAVAPGRESERIKLGDLTLNRRPDQVIEGAVANLSNSGGVRQAVGDSYGTGGLGGYLPPSPGNQGSNLELLSDPEGVDFRPYLLTVLASVRRNWYAVIPESARLAITRGKTTIQFAIVRSGSVSKLVIANSSGTQSLDRAAVAGISASNPFPPLPDEFTGKDIRLQFVFLYNIKTK